MIKLIELYHRAAIKANEDKIDAGNENQLVSWIQNNCKYDQVNEFFLVLGIGSELADIQAKNQGHHDEVDRAFKIVMSKPGMKKAHEKWLKLHR